ncbi:MAG: dihydrodipicolinate reductase C-terminal domain-containing protein [Candidatus Limnocylindrales bacterium]|nr:dihydrodipicolinate reductase C-terminal domain-containing protein [Candidatus Limnocylindrales bacterium]
MQAAILGDGPFGRAVANALEAHGVAVQVVGRPPTGAHDRGCFGGIDVVVDASRGEAVLANVRAAVGAGVRRLVIATTAWDHDRRDVAELLRTREAAAVAAANFSPGALVFARLAEIAARQMARLPGYEPYVVEWHRRGKADRPSGTARDLARRILAADPSLDRVSSPADGPAQPGSLEVVGVRAGANPGRHLVGFDGPGETLELTLTARDRSACASGVVAAADWLVAESRPAGLHRFDAVFDVDDRLEVLTAG